MTRLLKLILAAIIIASVIGWRDLKAQDVYLRDFPEAREHVDYALWAVNERAGFRAEYAGEAPTKCIPDSITVQRGSQAEWESHNPSSRWGALTHGCFDRSDSAAVIFNPTAWLTRSLMLHEIAHAMGCWEHTKGGHTVLYHTPQLWAALTVEDIRCIIAGSPFPRGEPDYCFTELLPNFDLVAPAALGMYRRLKFVGDIETGIYRWHPTEWIDVEDAPECDTVRMLPGGIIALDDVRSQHWRGSAELVGDGTAWVLLEARSLSKSDSN